LSEQKALKRGDRVGVGSYETGHRSWGVFHLSGEGSLPVEKRKKHSGQKGGSRREATIQSS